MKTILCYGDSNTWGCSDEGGGRYGIHVRWPGVLRDALGEGYHVVEEGLPGRTTVLDDPYEEWRNGLAYLRPCLDSHNPDLVILLLGTNDLKSRFNVSAWDVARGAARLAETVRATPARLDGGAPAVCLVAPPAVLDTGKYAPMFEGAAPKSRQLPPLYRAVAEETGCCFLDASRIIEPSPSEGLHWRRAAHQALGLALADLVRTRIDF
jgi:lysophospholipase L1-like esterase